MSVFSPLVFKSSDAGAPTLSGTAGDLLNVLSACLIVNKVFSTANDVAFNDNTAEARSQGGTPFTLFPTPAAGDRTYIGMTAKFNRAKFLLATLGVGGTYVFEYWNGAAWTTLTVTDGTAGFTQNGNITWTPPGDWATVAVNAVTQFWIRVRPTVNPSTNPTVNTLTVTGWSIKFGPTTNQADYQQGGGNQFFLDVNDNAPGAGVGREARAFGFETMSALGVGTGQFPTTAQLTAGIIPRKSTTADATTRTWIVVADDRTVYLFVVTGDTPAGSYLTLMFGDIFSAVNGDGFRTMIIGRHVENSGLASSENLDTIRTTTFTAITGHYVARAYTGTGGSVQLSKQGDSGKGAGNLALLGGLPFPNPSDGGVYIAPVWIFDPTTTPVNSVRGRLRGFWHFLHAIANVIDGDTLQGTGVLAGKTFLFIKQSQNNGLYTIETSDTWDVN